MINRPVETITAAEVDKKVGGPVDRRCRGQDSAFKKPSGGWILWTFQPSKLVRWMCWCRNLLEPSSSMKGPEQLGEVSVSWSWWPLGGPDYPLPRLKENDELKKADCNKVFVEYLPVDFSLFFDNFSIWHSLVTQRSLWSTHEYGKVAILILPNFPWQDWWQKG